MFQTGNVYKGCIIGWGSDATKAYYINTGNVYKGCIMGWGSDATKADYINTVVFCVVLIGRVV